MARKLHWSHFQGNRMSMPGHHPSRHPAASAQPFLATDIGGTHARVALVRAASDPTAGPDVLAYRSFDCAAFTGLAPLLQAFLAAETTTPVTRCVLACAGQQVGDEVLNDNSAWPIRVSALRRTLALDDLTVLNDFVALAHALDAQQTANARLLCGPDTTARGPVLVVGPGTGLGAAVRMPTADGTLVLTTEAGQVDFAPHSLRERAVLDWLAPQGGYVPAERLLSGPGLLTIYRALCAIDHATPLQTSPEAVTAAAVRRVDAHAAEAVSVFCAALGGFTGNLAMTFMAFGGVYLAGGFLDALFALLAHSAFEERFLHANSVHSMLSRIPVHVIAHGRLGVVGAARWYLQQGAPPPVHADGLAA